jgi:hypothetical protein
MFFKYFYIYFFIFFTIISSLYAQDKDEDIKIDAVIDGKYTANFILKHMGPCGKLPLKIEIDVEDLYFRGTISNGTEHPRKMCKSYHVGSISGKFFKNGDIADFIINQDDSHSKLYSSYKAEGSINEAILISKETRYHPRTKFTLKLEIDESKLEKEEIERVKQIEIAKKNAEIELIESEKEKKAIKVKEEESLINAAKEKKELQKNIELELIDQAKDSYKKEKIKKQIIEKKISTWTLSEVELLINDMEKFVAKNKNILDPINLIKLYRPVKSILKNKVINTKAVDDINAFNNFLMQNNDFAVYRNNKILEREGERLRILKIAQGKLNAILDFSITYISNNPLADEAYELTLIYNTHKENINSDEKIIIDNSIEVINKKLIALGIKESKNIENKEVVKEKKIKPAKPKSKPEQKVSNNKPKEIEKTVKVKEKKNKEETVNIKIFEENEDKDILVYLNLLSSAPHAYRDLEGNIKFEDKMINICWAHTKSIDAKYEYYLKLELQNKYKDHSISFLDICNLSKLKNINSNYDAIIFSKELFLKHKYSKIKGLINLINDKDYIKDFILTYNSFTKYISKREILSTQIEEDVLDGNRNGFGSLVIQNESNIACLIAEDKIDAHNVIIMRGVIFEEYQLIKGKKLDSIIKVSIENGFKQTQRGNCGLLYSDSNSLSKIYKALKNVKIKYQTIPDWVSIKDVDAKYQAILNRENKQLEDNAKRVAEAKLRKSEEDARRKKDLVEAKSKQAEFRRIYQPKVSSILDTFPDIAFNEELYPEFVEWFEMRKKSGWEEDTNKRNINIVDYGKVTWGTNRTLEADIISMVVSLKNRDQGLRKDHCFVFTKIVDVEFEMYREAINSECKGKNANRIVTWKKSFSFNSLWNVEELKNN